MAIATLIIDNGLKRIYRVATGRIAHIEINAEQTEIVCKLPNEKQCEEFCFRDLEDRTYKLV